MGGNEKRQPTVVCTVTVETRGIFPVNSRSRFDPLPTTRALKFEPLLFLSECSPVLAQFSQIRQTSNSNITDWCERPNSKRCLSKPVSSPFPTRLILTFTWSLQMQFFLTEGVIAEAAYVLCHLQQNQKKTKQTKKTNKKNAFQNIMLFSLEHRVMNCNTEMIIMMIEIISGIIKGQSQDAIMGDINCDLWLIFCEAESVEREVGHEQRMCLNMFAEGN